MKKQYEAPKAEIEEFEMEDTLCTSCGTPRDINGDEMDITSLWS